MQVVAKDGLTLDIQKYEQYGPPHMSAFYAVLHWGLMFASLGATITHVLLWHGKLIYRQYLTACTYPEHLTCVSPTLSFALVFIGFLGCALTKLLGGFD